jgi:hypothetical protein
MQVTAKKLLRTKYEVKFVSSSNQIAVDFAQQWCILSATLPNQNRIHLAQTLTGGGLL